GRVGRVLRSGEDLLHLLHRDHGVEPRDGEGGRGLLREGTCQTADGEQEDEPEGEEGPGTAVRRGSQAVEECCHAPRLGNVARRVQTCMAGAGKWRATPPRRRG